jgi:hypothetical protein
MLQIKRIASFHKATTTDHVPLKSVRVEAKLRSFAADVAIKQVFRNEE